MAQDTTVIAVDGDGAITAREVGHGRPLPAGWTITETRWNGRDIELVVDPARFDVVRVGSSAAGADATAPLEATRVAARSHRHHGRIPVGPRRA